MKGGNGKTDELTFEQPEEIAVFRKSKTGRFSPLYDSKPGAFLRAKESGTAGKIMFPSFVFAKDGIFLLSPLSKRRVTVAVRTVEGFCKDFRHNKKLSTKKESPRHRLRDVALSPLIRGAF